VKTFTTREIMHYHGVDKHRAWVMARYLVDMGMAKVVRTPPSGGVVYGTILDIKNKGLWERRKAGPKPEPSFYSNPFNLRNAVDGRWK
jgi:hypothetical protein